MRYSGGVNLKEWAASQGVSYAAARRWYKAGKLPVPAYQAGRLIVIGDGAPRTGGETVVYACVPSPGQVEDLDRQVARLGMWATSRGIPVHRVVTETGSAAGGTHPRLRALLRDSRVTTIVMDPRTWFGAGDVEAALAAQGRRLLIAPEQEDGT